MTWVTETFIDFTLTVAAFITVRADAPVAVANVFANSTVLAQVSHLDSFLLRSIFTGDHGHITKQTSPARFAETSVGIV